ncbi:CYTH domain-containing protein [Aureimonas leprariae]|uniref:CYTH domain-containing protein n=1 Tax=Plantimonas leprariae TaxID=2615207 RepID=A0A7V7PR94_9HYPH|nr:CYTH domain-containing protein [Aureimonas leprariae]KAB0681259.1 CYTH domain-containing protein [Aureimonas leprariae]
MGVEIERKFLVAGDRWRSGDHPSQGFRQFYLARADGFSARVRIVDEAQAFLTLKTGRGRSRGEFEYPIPLRDAHDLEAARTGELIAKRRHRIAHGRHVIEVDVFEDALHPLVVAEIELETEEDDVALPDWFGREVTDDPAFSNAALAADGLPEEFRS